MMPNSVVKFFQILVYPLVYLPFRWLYKNNLKIHTIFKKGEKYIFVANHPSRIDPFLVFYLIPFKELVKFLPIRFMTAKRYMSNPLSYFFLSLMGCYIINDEVLSASKRLINTGNSLCIFIQGRIQENFNSKPKVGAIYLEKEVRDSYMVPIKIEFQGQNLRKRAFITFKQKFRHNKFNKDLQPLANELLEIIKQ